jgi:hypothetical protein
MHEPSPSAAAAAVTGARLRAVLAAARQRQN